jgi:murein DD-endopeptidase MepM/ murein hydrolase activator NlpD
LAVAVAMPCVFWASLPGKAQSSLCPTPALARVVRHRVAAGETVQSIAQQYNLIPATLMGLNPALRGGKAAIGSEILVPPGNGIRVEVPPGQTLRDLAKTYRVRADLLFEVNGCQKNPRVVFVPGVNWSPVGAASQAIASDASQILASYPLPSAPSESAMLMGYGYTVQAGATQSTFHSGVDLAAVVDMAVLAAGNGTVAFAGAQGAYGNLVVVNHAEGLQTRYAQLGTIQVKVGQVVKVGQPLGTVGQSGRPSSVEPHLHFEVRSRSNLGWVAENPSAFLFRRSARR